MVSGRERLAMAIVKAIVISLSSLFNIYLPCWHRLGNLTGAVCMSVYANTQPGALCQREGCTDMGM